MATIKQKLVVKKIIENNGNVSKAMVEAGYPKTTARNPQQVTRSKGFKEVCKELGLTRELIVSSLKEDIEAKPQDRVPELKLGAKILKLIDNNKDTDKNTFNQFNIEVTKDKTDEFVKKMNNLIIKEATNDKRES